MKLLAGNSNLPLANAIADYLELPLTSASVRRFHRPPHEIGLEYEIFGWIAGELQFGEHHQLGPFGRRLRAPLEHRRSVAGEVADALVGLAQGDA